MGNEIKPTFIYVEEKAINITKIIPLMEEFNELLEELERRIEQRKEMKNDETD